MCIPTENIPGIIFITVVLTAIISAIAIGIHTIITRKGPSP